MTGNIKAYKLRESVVWHIAKAFRPFRCQWGLFFSATYMTAVRQNNRMLGRHFIYHYQSLPEHAIIAENKLYSSIHSSVHPNNASSLWKAVQCSTGSQLEPSAAFQSTVCLLWVLGWEKKEGRQIIKTHSLWLIWFSLCLRANDIYTQSERDSIKTYWFQTPGETYWTSFKFWEEMWNYIHHLLCECIIAH